MSRPESVYISVGAGFGNDRRDLGAQAAHALSLVDGPKYLIFECLAERTLALQSADPDKSRLPERAISFLDPCMAAVVRHGIRIVSNFGGPDPVRVATHIRAWLRAHGYALKVCAVTGDALPRADPSVIACNAYTGARGIVAALAGGADIVVTGRVADPSLAVGPAMHELGLGRGDLDALANATMAGHLIECGTQVCGGYFADAGLAVPGLASIGPPVACITREAVALRKSPGGGRLDPATVTQQLLYEIHDPAACLTPDVTLDITAVSIARTAPGAVRLAGAKGRPPPETLRTLTCRQTGWFGEAGISYTGATAAQRARLARDILTAQYAQYADGADSAAAAMDWRLECLDGQLEGIPHSRLRIAVRSRDKDRALHVLNAVEALYTNGPAGGGGVRCALDPMVETIPGLVPASAVAFALHW